MNRVSFITAGFVARELGYPGPEDWPAADRATNDRFRGLAGFRESFAALVRDVRALGFDAIDIWTAHLNWRWATDAHVAEARAILEREGMTVTSLAGSFGETEGELDAACALARALDVTLLAGRLRLLDADRETAVNVLARHGVTYAIENHDERGPAENAEIVDREPGRPWVAAAIDTGWYGTHGHDPVAAVELLGDRIAHVHLKDIERRGAHVTTGLGEGCLPLEATVRALRGQGYAGPIGIEHEPFDRDPSAECAASLELVRTWLGDDR